MLFRSVEVPNAHRSSIALREMLDTKDFRDHASRLCIALGQDVGGLNHYTDLAKMPHLLIGGAVDMVMSNSFEAIRYAQEKLPFLCIGSVFQKDPQVIICHPNVGHDKMESLKGKTILVGGTGRTS